MINREDLKQLQSLKSTPALSILLPTHRTSPDNRQDPIRVKNLVDEATARLSEEFSKRDIEPLLNNLEKIVNEIDYKYALSGLAIYVSHDFAQKYYLPFNVQERVIIDQTFATRDLVYGMNRAQRYWVLLLSESSTRLIAGTAETLEEIIDENFPMQMEGPGANEPLPGGIGVNTSEYLNEMHRQFFRQVDRTLTTYNKEEPLPLIVGGVPRYLSFFNELSQYAQSVKGTLQGNYDKSTLPELSPLVEPLRKSIIEEQRSDALDRLAVAVNSQRVVSTVGEVWRLAQEGRGQLLLVEKDYHQPGIIGENGLLELVDSVGGLNVIDDIVDEVIEAVMAKGGDVLFLDNDALSLYQKIALILRY